MIFYSTCIEQFYANQRIQDAEAASPAKEMAQDAAQGRLLPALPLVAFFPERR